MSGLDAGGADGGPVAAGQAPAAALAEQVGADGAGGADSGRSRRSVLFAGLILAVVALFLVFAVAVRRPASAPKVGGVAPDFRLTTYDGQPLDLAGLRGQVVLLNFWASWCLPCAAEAADLEAIWRDYKDRGVTVLGIAYTDTDPAARDYLRRHGVTYPNAPDRAARVSQAYHITGVPETFVIGRDGRILALPVGGEAAPKLAAPLGAEGGLSAGALRAVLDQALAAGGP